MNLTKSYLTDESGQIQSVVLDYHTYQKLQQLLLDEGSLIAMEEVAAEEEVDYEEVRELIKLHFFMVVEKALSSRAGVQNAILH